MQAPAMRAISVPRLVATFREQHPHVEVRIRHSGGSAETAVLVREGQLDMGIIALPERRSPGLALTLLSSEPVYLACAPTHRFAGRADIELSALADEPFAETPPGWGTRMVSDRAFAAAGVRRTIDFEVNDASAVIEFVCQGLAVALMPRFAAFDDDAVVFVPIRHHAPAFETSIAVSSERRLSAATRALLELAQQQAASAADAA
jgi:DNA-binding transcriptional LysR family regulator